MFHAKCVGKYTNIQSRQEEKRALRVLVNNTLSKHIGDFIAITLPKSCWSSWKECFSFMHFKHLNKFLPKSVILPRNLINILNVTVHCWFFLVGSFLIRCSAGAGCTILHHKCMLRPPEILTSIIYHNFASTFLKIDFYIYSTSWNYFIRFMFIWNAQCLLLILSNAKVYALHEDYSFVYIGPVSAVNMNASWPELEVQLWY